jgi:hypothetical protein
LGIVRAPIGLCEGYSRRAGFHSSLGQTDLLISVILEPITTICQRGIVSVIFASPSGVQSGSDNHKKQGDDDSM